MWQSAKTSDSPSVVQDSTESEWLQLARDAYTTSTDYFDANVRKNMENAMAHFSNRHAPGSKYLSDAYKHRARGFRPKTRATVRRNEAAAAVAYFSTQDAVDITPENDADEWQRFSAELNGELLNYRLEHSVPWFLNLVGAYQDSMNAGVVVSHQYWKYEEVDGDTVCDKPILDIIPPENFRFSQAADWRDPAGTSPYLIELIPMFIGDIRERAERIDDKTGDPEWFDVSDKEIKAAADWDYDSVRSAREGHRQNAKEADHTYTDFDIAWVHRNIIRKDGEDWIYYTLGVTKELSEPVKLSEAYPHLGYGERPYVVGFSTIETHKTYPAGVTTLVHSLQQEANDIANQRRDNVVQVLNKRHYARRGANVDWKMLRKSVPGSVVLMDDIGDVQPEDHRDVTSSAYEEQNRINVDLDELAGSFSAGSVATNRQMNETVGGMNLLQSDSNVVSEYQLRVFNETWVEPVLRQMVLMEQEYETDPRLLQIVGANTKAASYGITQIIPEMFQGIMNVRVNVGFGSTSPEQRIQKVVLGLDSVLKYAPDRAQEMDFGEVVKEIFGALGYKGSERFFPSLEQDNPQVQQMQQQIQALQQELESRTSEIQLQNQGKLENTALQNEGDMQQQILEQEFKMWNEERDREIEWAKLQQQDLSRQQGMFGQPQKVIQ